MSNFYRITLDDNGRAVLWQAAAGTHQLIRPVGTYRDQREARRVMRRRLRHNAKRIPS